MATSLAGDDGRTQGVARISNSLLEKNDDAMCE